MRWMLIVCYTMVYKLTNVYIDDAWHYYAQEYLPLAYYNEFNT